MDSSTVQPHVKRMKWTKKIIITLLGTIISLEITSIALVTHSSFNMNNATIVTNSGQKCVITDEQDPFVKKIIENNHRYGALFPFRAPFRLIVAGPSESGKTTFVKRLVDESRLMIIPSPVMITWFYAEWQPWFEKLRDRVKFVEGIPTATALKYSENHLVIIDDLFQDITKETVNLFAVGSHHKNISVIFITQNFFHKSAHQRNISLNASHVAFFKNPRDKMQITYLSKQMFPQNSNFLVKAYEDATKDPYTYLLVDLTQRTDDHLRVRTKIFLGEYTRIYLPK